MTNPVHLTILAIIIGSAFSKFIYNIIKSLIQKDYDVLKYNLCYLFIASAVTICMYIFS